LVDEIPPEIHYLGESENRLLIVKGAFKDILYDGTLLIELYIEPKSS